MFPVQIAVFKMVKTSYQFQKLLSLLTFLVTSQTTPFQRHTHFCAHNAPEKYFSFKLFFFFTEHIFPGRKYKVFMDNAYVSQTGRKCLLYCNQNLQ